jgi:hypothetical protein
MRHIQLGLLAVGLLAWGAGKAQSQGTVGFAPIPAQIFDGAALSVQPVVTADRRYVRLGVRPVFSTVEGFDVFPVPAAVAGGGFGGGPRGGIGGGPGFRNVGPGPAVRAAKVKPAPAPKVVRPRSVAARTATIPRELSLPAPPPSTYRAGDPFAGLGPSGFEPAVSRRLPTSVTRGSTSTPPLVGSPLRGRW